LGCAESDFGSFQALVPIPIVFNRSAPNPTYRYKFSSADFVFSGE